MEWCIMSIVKTLKNACFYTKEAVLTAKDVAMVLLMLAYLLVVLKTSL